MRVDKATSLVLICLACFLVIPPNTSVSGHDLVLNIPQPIPPSNVYRPTGSMAALLALDASLLGPTNFFPNLSMVQQIFKAWITPFETKFGITIHIPRVWLFSPGKNDSLYDTLSKVYDELPWLPTSAVNSPGLDKNGYDILMVYQKEYNSGRNHVNAILGNSLIIAHNQPGSWTTPQLILLHELAHLFGGEHLAEGEVPRSWYGDASLTILDYENLAWMRIVGFNEGDLPIDDHNLDIMVHTNRSEFGFPNYMYRFDYNDPDQDILPNWFEYQYGLNATDPSSATGDPDGDGLSSRVEWEIGTLPTHSDSDNDTFPDNIEVEAGTDPLDPGSFPHMVEPAFASVLHGVYPILGLITVILFYRKQKRG